MVDTVEKLLLKGADPSLENVGGVTAMDLASEMGNHVIVGLIQDRMIHHNSR